MLIMKDNKFYSNYGYTANILGSLPGGKKMKILAIDNHFYSEELGEDSFLYDIGETTLLQDSRYNSATDLNYNTY